MGGEEDEYEGFDDLEGTIRSLLRKYDGIEVVLGLRYTDPGSSDQNSYIFHHTDNYRECRKMVRMLWESIQGASPAKVATPEEIEEDEDE